MEIIVIVGVCVMLAAGIALVLYAIIALIRSERKKRKPKTVITSDVEFYDEIETVENCTVEILRNSKTGEVSVGWYRNE